VFEPPGAAEQIAVLLTELFLSDPVLLISL
jgi:hypothetical protein